MVQGCGVQLINKRRKSFFNHHYGWDGVSSPNQTQIDRTRGQHEMQ